MLSKKLILLLLFFVCINTYSQKKDLPNSLHQLVFAARYHVGFIFAHNIHVQNTKGTHPDGFELEFAHMHSDSATFTKFKCFARTGFSFTYVDFNKVLLGKSYSINYFLEPSYKLVGNLKFDVRLSAGFSWLTNPHDAEKNPANQSYSGHINNFLQVDAGVSYPLSKHMELYAMENFFHNSNGGLKEPNAGVNYINTSVGLQYFMHSTHLPSYNKIRDTSWKHKPAHFDVSVFYSPKVGYDKYDTSRQVRKYVLGTSAQIIKQVSNLDAITFAAEIYYDDALKSIKEIYVKDTSSSILAGVLIGHQFLLNRFTFTQQLGCYIHKQTTVYDKTYQDLFHTIYHRWGLNYRINNKWFAGITLLAHNQIADFIDGRITYRIR